MWQCAIPDRASIRRISSACSMHFTPRSPTAWGWGCRFAGRSSKPMGAGCGQRRMNLAAPYFSSLCPSCSRRPISRDRGRTKKIRARPGTPARRILCDQHRRTVGLQCPELARCPELAQLRPQIVPWSTLCRADWVRNEPVLTTCYATFWTGIGAPRFIRHRRRKKIRARPRTPARRILCDQHRRTVAYSVPN